MEASDAPGVPLYSPVDVMRNRGMFAAAASAEIKVLLPLPGGPVKSTPVDAKV